MIGGVLELARQQVWALDRRVLASFEEILLRRAEGTRLSRDEIATALAAAGQPARRGPDELVIEQGGIGVVPIRGVIAQRASLFDDVSPGRGTSVERISGMLQKAAADSAVRGVLLEVDSPGGTVTGIPELADEIRGFEQATGKPVWAFSDGMVASAAYWLAGAASRIAAIPSAQIGSIGIYSVLRDSHRAADALGVQVHVVSTGPHKGAGEPGTQITRQQLDGVQKQVDAFFDLFKGDVAKDRGLQGQSLDQVCDGQCWLSSDALQSELIDQVATRNQVLRDFRALLGERQPTTSGGIATRGDVPIPTAARAEANMEPKTESKIETVDALRATYPQLVEQILAAERTSASTALQQTVGKAKDEAVAAERARCGRILKNAKPGQIQMAAELVASDCDVADAIEKLANDPRRDVAALLQKEVDSAAPQIDGSVASTGKVEKTEETVEQRCARMAQAEFDKDPKAARDTYGSVANLTASLVAAARGVSCVRD